MAQPNSLAVQQTPPFLQLTAIQTVAHCFSARLKREKRAFCRPSWQYYWACHRGRRTGDGSLQNRWLVFSTRSWLCSSTLAQCRGSVWDAAPVLCQGWASISLLPRRRAIGMIYARPDAETPRDRPKFRNNCQANAADVHSLLNQHGVHPRKGIPITLPTLTQTPTYQVSFIIPRNNPWL